MRKCTMSKEEKSKMQLKCTFISTFFTCMYTYMYTNMQAIVDVHYL